MRRSRRDGQPHAARAGRLGRATLLLGLAAALVASSPGPVGSAGPETRFDCLLEPSAVVELSAPVIGIVKEMLVDRGDRVQRGQVVARLHDAMERANLAVAEHRARAHASVQQKRERFAFEERRLARNSRLIEGNIITEKEADEIKTARTLAMWELKDAEELAALAQLQRIQAETDLAQREVRSPVDGVVIERARDPGESTASSHLLKIVQLDPLHVEAFIPASVVTTLKIDQAASIVPESTPDRRLRGHLKIIDRVADAASGMVKVRIVVPNADYAELSGLRCAVFFDRGAQ